MSSDFVEMMSRLLDNSDNNAVILIVVLYVGIWVAFVQVFSLLLANEESVDGVEEMSLKELKPWFVKTAKRTWYLPLFFMGLAFLSFVPVLGFVILVLMVPLALMPALHIVERLNIWEASTKALSMGFPIWFKMAFNIVLVSLLGLYVFFALFIPSAFLNMIIDTLSTSQLHELERLSVIALGFVFALLAILGWCIVQSMVVLLCAYHYGSSSEEKDASSLEGEVANFGKWKVGAYESTDECDAKRLLGGQAGARP